MDKTVKEVADRVVKHVVGGFCEYQISWLVSHNDIELEPEEEPKLYDYVMRGGEWSEEGNWQPDNKGLGYWFVIKWLNKFGQIGIKAPGIDKYEEEYGDKRTKEELKAA